MKCLRGKAIAPGYAAGQAIVLEASLEGVPHRTINSSDLTAEFARFDQAITRSAEELDDIRGRVRQELGKSHSAIFESHLAILNDPSLIKRVRRRIERELINAEQALQAELAEISDQMTRIGDPYLRERHQDIRDVGRRLLSHLMKVSFATTFNLAPQSILVARELLPSDTLNLDRQNLAAIVTEEGGETSHGAILARALGVPAVTAVGQLMRHVHPGAKLLVNGESGEVIVSPSLAQLAAFTNQSKGREQQIKQDLCAESLACVTTDGVEIQVLANVARPEECAQVMQHRLDGIGLLRTEFLFLDAEQPPGVDFQYEVYRQIADAVPAKVVVARTLDMAGDKRPRFLASQFEHEALAFRGLRFSLKERNLFVSQVSALTRLSERRDLRILLPMVIDPQDVTCAIEIIEDCARRQGVKRRPAVGVMIETPAAVVLLDRFLEHIDFVSIGTNDLTQYLLAADRGSIDLDDDYSVLHPAMLHTIHQIVVQCAVARRPLSVCGEAAGDPKTACLLVGMGIRQLSMSPVRAGRVRRLLRSHSLQHLQDVANEALACSTTAEARQLLANKISIDNLLLNQR